MVANEKNVSEMIKEEFSQFYKFQYRGKTYQFCSTQSDEYILSSIKDKSSFYESDLLEILSFLPIGEGDFVDVGANIGNHSVFFSSELERKVYAFEADSKSFKCLEKNIKENGVENRVRYFNVALSDVPEIFDIESDSFNSAASHISSKKSGVMDRVFSTTLDRFVGSDVQLSKSKVALLRIDVEGFEQFVINGARAVIEKHLPFVLVQASDSQDSFKLFELLNSLDYMPILIGGKSDAHIFVHISQANACNDISTLYCQHQYEKSGGKVELENWAFSKEFRRIKSMLTNLYNANRRERRKNENSDRKISELIMSARLWESEASRLCGKIKDHNTSSNRWQKKIKPEFITGIRKNIKKAVADASSEEEFIISKNVTLAARHSIINSSLKVVILAGDVSSSIIDKTLAHSYARGMKKFHVILDKNSDYIPPHSVSTVKTEQPWGELKRQFSASDNSSILILTPNDRINVDSIIDTLESSVHETLGTDILVFDGLTVDNDINESVCSGDKKRVSLLESFNKPSQVVSSASMNAYIPKPCGLNLTALPDVKAMVIKFSLSATRAGVRLIALPKENIVDINTSGDELKQVKEYIFDHLDSFHLPKPSLGETLAIVGRLDEERWSRGGIYHSCRSYAGICENLGVKTTLLEIDQDPAEISEQCRLCDVVFIYTGDQVAQDFFNVVPLLKVLDRRGHIVVVNLSYDTHPSRTQEINEVMAELSDNIKLMVFSNDIENTNDLNLDSDRIVIVPKTIKEVARIERDFEETQGIFMGDLGKFLNPRITANAEDIARSLNDNFPEIKLLFVEQYKHAHKVPAWLKNFKTHQYDKNLTKEFLNARMYLHSQNFCTFEMLPVEACFSGVPVVYHDMPQSLNSYIAEAGQKFKSVDSMLTGINKIYYDKTVWELFSKKGAERGGYYTSSSQQDSFHLMLSKLRA